MKRILQSVLLTAFCCGCTAADEELDAALNALKKKAARRNYSERAVLHKRNLNVPSADAGTEKALDEKLRLMEQKLSDHSPAPARPGPRFPQARPLPRQQENNNWLTPALLDNSAGIEEPVEEKSPWITQELERQKTLQLEKDAVAKEYNLPGQQRGDQQQSPPFSPLNPADNYRRSLQDILSGTPAQDPRYSPAQREEKAPAKEASPFAAKQYSSSGLFPSRSDPEPKKKTPFSFGTEPFRVKRSTLKPQPSFSERNKKPAPLPPLKKLRKSSLFDKDPFAEDNMPKVNQSIWD